MACSPTAGEYIAVGEDVAVDNAGSKLVQAIRGMSKTKIMMIVCRMEFSNFERFILKTPLILGCCL
jgi:hypothetical protein